MYYTLLRYDDVRCILSQGGKNDRTIWYPTDAEIHVQWPIVDRTSMPRWNIGWHFCLFKIHCLDGMTAMLDSACAQFGQNKKHLCHTYITHPSTTYFTSIIILIAILEYMHPSCLVYVTSEYISTYLHTVDCSYYILCMYLLALISTYK